MTTRFKLIAATLGLVVAASAVGDVSAKTIERTAPHKTIVAHHPHRAHLGTRITEHARFAHRLPLRSKVVIVHRPFVKHVVTVRPALVRTVVARPVVGTTIRGKLVRLGTFGGRHLHLAKRPLVEKHAMNHRAGKTTIIR